MAAPVELLMLKVLLDGCCGGSCCESWDWKKSREALGARWLLLALSGVSRVVLADDADEDDDEEEVDEAGDEVFLLLEAGDAT